ncbi:MAG: hypothetical protein SO135_05765 [Sphaerochaetaceae bacterium]|nr:hypothetical protein [Sphaerochaetaceae bacterium]NLY06879.1 hypothetical protein [Spirochaetales bacterium]
MTLKIGEEQRSDDAAQAGWIIRDAFEYAWSKSLMGIIADKALVDYIRGESR